MNDQNANLFIYNGALPNSPTAKSDLRIGDKILSLNGVPLLQLEDLNIAIENNPQKRIMEVLRGSQILTIEIDLSSEKEKSSKINLN